MRNYFVLILVFTLILFYHYNKSTEKFDISPNCPVVKNSNFNTITGDILIKPIGCYINIIDQFFSSCINPYSTQKNPDNGIWVMYYPNDIIAVINQSINNGFDLYGNKILNKYRGTDYKDLSLIELATLGYFCGYTFISITNFNGLNQIFFSYSQPLSTTNGQIAKPDLPFTLMPKQNGYTNEVENVYGKELSCGNVCLKDNKPQIDPVSGNVYTCGSILSPTIKTPPRYSVYQIYEKI